MCVSMFFCSKFFFEAHAAFLVAVTEYLIKKRRGLFCSPFGLVLSTEEGTLEEQPENGVQTGIRAV